MSEPLRLIKATPLIIILFLLWLMPDPVLADTKAQADQQYILVTAFEPFGGGKTNGSWEAVQHLQGSVIANKKLIVYQLPVIWEKASVKMAALINEYHPVAVIAFGEAGAEPVRVEMVAKNSRDLYRDNLNQKPATDFISSSAPATLRTTLNADLIIKRLHEIGIPAGLSQDAGGYLCNETFFNLMNFAETAKTTSIQRGFIHVPPLNARVVMPDNTTILFDKGTLKKTADVVVRAVAEGPW
jgi:pyroglutamyl-peptidase